MEASVKLFAAGDWSADASIAVIRA
jgi:hypothetical protein